MQAEQPPQTRTLTLVSDAATKDRFAPVKTFCLVNDVGGWSQVIEQVFADGGIGDRLFADTPTTMGLSCRELSRRGGASGELHSQHRS